MTTNLLILFLLKLLGWATFLLLIAVLSRTAGWFQ